MNTVMVRSMKDWISKASPNRKIYRIEDCKMEITFHMCFNNVLCKILYIYYLYLKKLVHLEVSWQCSGNANCKLVSEKGRDLTQSYDKSPYTDRTIQKAT